MGDTGPSKSNCRGSQCLHQEDKDGHDQTRCCLCCIWFHIECVGVPKKEKNWVWTCFDCREIYPTVKSLEAQIKGLKDSQVQMMNLLQSISDQLTKEKDIRTKVESELINAKSQLTDANHKLDRIQSHMNEQEKATPSAPTQETPTAPPLPNLLLGTSLLRNVDPKKLSNTEVIAKSGAKIEELLKEMSSLNEEKTYDKVFIVGGSIDLESKDEAEIVLDFQALITAASLRSHSVTMSSILPRIDKDVKIKTKNVNEKLQEVCNTDGHTFIDNDPAFLLMNGQPNDANLTNDGLHLTKRGVDSLCKSLGIMQNGSAFTPTRYPKTEKSGTLHFKGHEHPLSNFFDVTINYNGQKFANTETAYQFCKAETMGDDYRAGRILQAETGLHAMRIASKIQTDERWTRKKRQVMEELIKQKLRVCEKARKTLLDSDSKEIIEDTAHEYWGRGKDGKGQNTLGKIWMKLRDQIRKDPNCLNRNYGSTTQKRTWATRQWQPRCYHCGDTGHVARLCWKTQPVSCWACGLTGHKQKNCDYFTSRSRNHRSDY